MNRHLALTLTLLLAACGTETDSERVAPTVSGFTITSPAFAADARIPVRFTGQGDDVSPALAWTGAPEGSKELLLICDDPDAPMDRPFVHWVIAGIPAETTEIAEGGTPAGAAVGTNDFGVPGYRGPMPPPGAVHHYRFRLYALDAPLGLAAGVTKAQALAEADGHILAMAEHVGTFSTE